MEDVVFVTLVGICMIAATEFKLSMFKYSVASQEIGEIVVLLFMSPSIK